MGALIGYENLLESASYVGASSEAAGYSAANAYDWLGYDAWKPTAIGTDYITANFSAAQSVDYFAAFFHDLATQGASVQLQYSTDGGATWLNAFAAQAPTTNRVVFVSFGSISAPLWRVALVSPAGPSYLGAVAFGTALELPRSLPTGWAPPTLNRKNKYMTNQSESGVFLAKRLKRRGAAVQFDVDLLLPSWIRSTWDAFADHADSKPFFMSWDMTNYPDEAAFCWTTADIQTDYSQPNYMRAKLSGEALTTL